MPDSYRDHLIEAGHVASRDYDRAVMALSGGALAVSFAFVRDLVPHPRDLIWLVLAWCSFGGSLLSILISFLTSQTAIRRAVKTYDKGEGDLLGHVGGLPGQLTTGLNIVAAGAFLVGVVFLVVFAWLNLHGLTATAVRGG